MKTFSKNEVIGQWRIINDEGLRKILCRCTGCGEEKYVDRYSIGKSSNSCFKCSIKKRLSGNSAYNRLIRHYKKSAKDRGIEFSLTQDEFIQITKSRCFYCKKEPENLIKEKYDEYIYNGIDRIDSTRGYTKENCVPCCDMCNKMKNDISQNDFFNWIKKIHDYQKENFKTTP